ncbi:MAG: alginate export family protein [Candidatus Omnitrophota bacterium]
MSRRLMIFLAVVVAVGLAIPAFAAVQNVKVGGDIEVVGVARNNFLFVSDAESLRATLAFTRVRVDADLTDNVSTTVRLLNEREWGAEVDTGSQTGVDVDLAYVTLKEMLYSPLTVVIGRQELRYGNGFLIGAPATNGQCSARSQLDAMSGTNPGLEDFSKRKSFDALKAILDYNPLTIDLFYAKLDAGVSTTNTILIHDDVELYGVNAAYKVNDTLNTEVYYFQRNRQPDGGTLNNSSTDDITRTIGARGVYAGIKNLVLQLEGAHQSGVLIDNDTLYINDQELTVDAKYKRNAWALQAIAMYTPENVKYDPSFTASFTHLSGQKDGSISDNYTGWDGVCEDQAGGTIFNAILGYSNANFTNVSASMKPMQDVKVILDYYSLMLDKAYLPGSVTLSGAAGTKAYTMRGKKHLGDEVDLGVVYDYTEDVQLGLSGGMFFCGSAFDKTVANKTVASQLIGSMKVTF